MLGKAAPYWTAGNTLMYLTKPNEKGEAEYVDLSYMLPYEFMLAPARAAMQTYAAKGEVGASEAEQILSGAWEGFKKFAEPFASEALATERLIDVTIRQGKTQTGAEIWEDGELAGDKLAKGLNHVVGAFIPGIVDQYLTVKGGQFKEGRVTRAVEGIPSAAGDPYTIAEEAGTMLTGLRPMKLNIARTLAYAGGEYSALRSSAVQIFTKVADDNDATVEDITRAYAQANEARRRQQANLKADIDAAMAAGMSKAQIIQAFKNTGVSRKEVVDMMNNRYTPIKVSRDLIREVYREANVLRENRILNRLPVQEINALRRDLINTPIVGEREPVTSKEPIVLETAPWGDTPAPQPRSVPEPRPSETFVGRTMDTITGTGRDLAQGLRQRAQAIAPSLLGGDPASQAANAEIARRSQGQ